MLPLERDLRYSTAALVNSALSLENELSFRNRMCVAVCRVVFLNPPDMVRVRSSTAGADTRSLRFFVLNDLSAPLLPWCSSVAFFPPSKSTMFRDDGGKGPRIDAFAFVVWSACSARSAFCGTGRFRRGQRRSDSLRVKIISHCTGNDRKLITIHIAHIVPVNGEVLIQLPPN